jgi:transposase InsO family protein
MLEKYQDKAPVRDICRWIFLPRSSFYYKPLEGKKGSKPSIETLRKDGTIVPNTDVVDKIRAILSGEFVCYGYQKIAMQLKSEEYIINHKKVYRLMDQNSLLLGKKIITHGKRQWVKHRKIRAVKPMEYLCLDIKYLWIHGEKRFYYLLTILDVYSRKVLQWILQKSVRKIDVINLFRHINLQYGIKGVNVRNDNGSQFIAHDVRQFLRAAEANQEFTHVATPEENAYIEAYHSILETEVVQRFEFESYYEAKLTIEAYVEFYNNRRLHGGIDYKTPQQVWKEFEEKEFANFIRSGQAESGNAGEQPARNNLTDEDDLEGGIKPAPSSSESESSLFNIPEKTHSQNHYLNSNLFEKSVQIIGG